MKTKSKLLTMALAVALVLTAILTMPTGKALASEIQTKNYTITYGGEYNEYTDSLYFYDKNTKQNDTTKYLTDYPEYFIGRFKDNNDKLHDEWIEGFVPKELFLNEGQTMHIGKEYSFVVVNDIKYIYVAFFKTEIEVNKDSDGTISLRLKPLFSYAYKYSAEDDKISPRVYHRSGDYSYSTSTEGISYHLKDTCTSAYLQNVNNANKGDADYTGRSDNGAFFTDVHYYYKGASKKDAGEIFADAANIFGFALGLAVGPVAGKAVDIIGSIVDAIETGAVIINSQANDNYYRVEKTNATIKPKLFHTTKDSQLSAQEAGDAMYSNGLIKNTVAYISTTDKDPLLINTNEPKHFVETMYRISTTNHDRTRFTTQFCTNLVQENSVGNISYPGRNIESNKITIDFWGENETEGITESQTKNCYMLAGGEKKYVFVPEKNNEYEFTAPERSIRLLEDGVLLETATGSVRRKLTEGKTYTFVVEGETEDTVTLVGLWMYYTEIAPDQSRSVRIKASETEYLKFNASETGLYLFNLVQPAGVGVEFKNEAALGWSNFSDGRYPLFCEAGLKYLVRFHNNSGKDAEFSVALSHAPEYDETLSLDGNSSFIEYLVIQTSFNGNFELRLNSSKQVELAVFDGYMNPLQDLSGSSLTYPMGCSKNQQYIIRIASGIDGSCDYNVNLRFVPQRLVNGTNSIGTIDGSNVAEFVPGISGRYDFASNGALEFFDSEGNLKNDNFFEEGQAYYVSVRRENTATISVELLSTGITANTIYALNQTESVSEVFAFEPLFSGRFVMTGNFKVKIYNASMSLLSESKDYSLLKGNRYLLYVYDYTAATFKLKFSPPEILANQRYSIVNSAIYELCVDKADNFSFEITKNTTSSLKIFDPNANLKAQTSGSVSVGLTAGFFYVEISGSDSNVGLLIKNSDFDAGNNKLKDSFNGVSYISSAPNTEAEYTFECKHSATYLLNMEFNAGFEAVDAFDGSVVESRRAGEYWVSQYSIELTGNKNYIFKFFTQNLSALNVQFYAPANYDKNGFDVKEGGVSLGNANRLGLGRTFDIILRSASDTKYITEDAVRCSLTLKGAAASLVPVVCNSRMIRFSLPKDVSLVGTILTLDIYFDNAGHKDFDFELVFPFEFGLSRENYELVPTVKDFKNTNIFELENGDFVKIKFFDVRNGVYETTPFFETALTGLSSVDLLKLNNLGNVKVRADFKMDGFEKQIETVLNFSSDKYDGLSNVSGKRKIIFDVTQISTNVNKTVTIYSDTEVVNIFGDAGKTYVALSFAVNDRTRPLLLNFNDFRFECENLSALKYTGSETITLNAEGNVSMSTKTRFGVVTIDVKNLCLTGTNLTVNAGGSNVHNYSGAVGIRSENLTVGTSNLRVVGGFVWDTSSESKGQNGGKGGNAIETVNIVLQAGAGLHCFGGNGGRGGDGDIGAAGQTIRPKLPRVRRDKGDKRAETEVTEATVWLFRVR